MNDSKIHILFCYADGTRTHHTLNIGIMAHPVVAVQEYCASHGYGSSRYDGCVAYVCRPGSTDWYRIELSMPPQPRLLAEGVKL